MKIAYLIQAHDHYLHLQKLIDALNGPDCRFYIHIDRKSVMPQLKGDNIFFIKERANIHWGGFSQVRATLHLLKEAVAGGCDYYAFISGKDYPVKPNRWLLEKLQNGGEYIHIQKMGEDPFAPLSRYKYYYFTDYYNRQNKQSRKTKFFLWLQQTLRKLRVRKKIPFQLYTGASWFVLSKSCVSYVLKQVAENPVYVHFFKSGFCPDESFFQTIIGNSPFYKNTKDSLTYADWSVDPGPAIITEKHLPVLKNLEHKFFARKFTDESNNIIQQIDKELRTINKS